MGGYAFYVWPAYGFGLVVLLLNLWVPLRRHHRLLGDVRARRRNRPG